MHLPLLHQYTCTYLPKANSRLRGQTMITSPISVSLFPVAGVQQAGLRTRGRKMYLAYLRYSFRLSWNLVQTSKGPSCQTCPLLCRLTINFDVWIEFISNEIIAYSWHGCVFVLYHPANHSAGIICTSLMLQF